jgi:hypothetical protein
MTNRLSQTSQPEPKGEKRVLLLVRIKLVVNVTVLLYHGLQSLVNNLLHLLALNFFKPNDTCMLGMAPLFIVLRKKCMHGYRPP